MISQSGKINNEGHQLIAGEDKQEVGNVEVVRYFVAAINADNGVHWDVSYGTEAAQIEEWNRWAKDFGEDKR